MYKISFCLKSFHVHGISETLQVLWTLFDFLHINPIKKNGVLFLLDQRASPLKTQKIKNMGMSHSISDGLIAMQRKMGHVLLQIQKKKTKKIVVCRSPHIHKKSREQFQMVTHRKTITIWVQNKNLVFLLLEILNTFQATGTQLEVILEYNTKITPLNK